jgi:thioredoxin-dependent peroxiredoxin
MLKPGQPAPLFSLPDHTATVVELRELLTRGEVIVMFYPGDDTPLCTKEACMVRDIFSQLRSANVTVVGISPQGVSSKANFREKHQLQHIMLADEGGKVAKLFGARGMFGLQVPFGALRATFWIGKDGIIRDVVHSEFSLAKHEALLQRAISHASS